MLDDLCDLARGAASLAYAPYSGRPEAAVLLLSDGTWIPGVRVECASFSLTIQGVRNALCTALSAARTDILALVLSRPALPSEQLYLSQSPLGRFTQIAPDCFVRDDEPALLALGARFEPFLQAPRPLQPATGVQLARGIATRAVVPESGFPVGCVLAGGEGRLLAGVNVELADWTWILCAERSALGAAVSYGVRDLHTLYLSCPDDATCTPCGSCRQLLMELAPGAVLWMDRGAANPQAESISRLLPGSFTGRMLSQHRPPKA